MSQQSDFNLQSISTKDFADNLKATIEFGGNIIVIGRRGSGKTQISKETIAQTGCKELYLNLSVMERPDIGGYPNFFAAQEGKSYVNFLLPAFYESLIEGNEPVVALLDEVDKAEAGLLAPLLEFTQFHTINGRKLPNLKAIVMTGNLPGEGGNRPSLPLLDRAEKYKIEISTKMWLDWGGMNGEIHPSVSAYISDHQEDLYGDTDPGELYADPSPRGWHNASKILFFGESKKWSPKLITNKVSGYVGQKAGMKYDAYFTHYQVLLPIVDKIMKGDFVKGFSELENSKKMIACMIICARLARLIDERPTSQKALPKEAKIIGNFLKNIDPETAFVALRSQIGLHRAVDSGLDEEPEWDSILKELSTRIKA